MNRKVFWSVVLLIAVAILIYIVATGPLFYRRPRNPNVILITMDTARADRIGCYGYDKIQTPNIDSLAGDGILFKNAYSPQPITLVTHSSIMTGLYPYNHGVRDNIIYRLSDKQTTMAEIMSKMGYTTSAFVSSYILNSRFGLAQGFSNYNDTFITSRQKGRLPVERQAQEVSFLARKWIEAFKDRPFFLWLHYYDPHATYDPPAPYADAYPDKYDGEMAYTDDMIGWVIDYLKQENLYDNSLIILTADHGEALGEHGEATHGYFAYASTTHVPLIIKFPDKEHAGIVIEDTVSNVNILPTLLGYLNLKVNLDFDGIDMMGLIKGDEGFKQTVYSETEVPKSFSWSPVKNIRDDEYLYILAPEEELYNLKKDKGEIKNIFQEKADIADKYRTLLNEMISARDEREAYTQIDQESLARITALGYFAGGMVSVSDLKTGLKDPKQTFHLFRKYQRLVSLSENNRIEDAVILLTELLKEDENNIRFIQELGNLSLRVRDYDKAIDYYKQAIGLNSADPKLHSMLADAYLKKEDESRAIKELQSALAIDATHVNSNMMLAAIYLNKKDYNNAQKHLEAALETDPDNFRALNNLGYIVIKRDSDCTRGIELIRKALFYASDSPLILDSLGWAYFNCGDDTRAERYLRYAFERSPGERIYSHLLKLYEKTGETEKAEKIKARAEKRKLSLL